MATTPPTTTPSGDISSDDLLNWLKSIGAGAPTTVTDKTEWPYRSAIGVTGRLYENPATGATAYEGYRYAYGPQEAPAIFNQPSPKTVTEPQYFSGDEDTLLGRMSQEELLSVQAALVGVGYLGSYRPGIIDPPTVTAFTKLLGVANRYGVDYKEAAVALYSMPEMGAGGSGGSMPTYKLSNPDDLKLVFNQAARSIVGRELDQGTIDQLVKTFQSNEKNFYLGSGELVEPPSAEALVQKQIETTAPAEAEAKSYGDYVGLLSQLMGG